MLPVVVFPLFFYMCVHFFTNGDNKCKSGDLSDVNNYRAIALSNSASKILETLLFNFIETSNATDTYQFGFRKNHSTSICTHVFKKTVDYYRQNGSHVFTCFITGSAVALHCVKAHRQSQWRSPNFNPL